nr:MAG TPA_asm: hypothetical protein [Caudoviricetes sp.]
MRAAIRSKGLDINLHFNNGGVCRCIFPGDACGNGIRFIGLDFAVLQIHLRPGSHRVGGNFWQKEYTFSKTVPGDASRNISNCHRDKFSNNNRVAALNIGCTAVYQRDCFPVLRIVLSHNFSIQPLAGLVSGIKKALTGICLSGLFFTDQWIWSCRDGPAPPHRHQYSLSWRYHQW